MNGTDMLIDFAQRPGQALGFFADRLDATVLNSHPAGQDNSPAWLLWHAARQWDMQLSDLSGREQVWSSQGFAKRSELAGASDRMGFGDTPEQARAIRVDDAAVLVELLAAVADATEDYVRSLSDTDLDDVVDRDWDPPVTRGQRLVSIINDASEHVAQAAYVVGMDRSQLS